MSLVATWLSMLRSCLPPLESLGAQLVACRHPMVEFLRAPHLSELDVPGLLKLSFHVIQQLVLDLQTSGLFGGSQFALKLAALPQRSAHVDPHTASMRPNAHAWSNPPATFRWRVRLPHHDGVISSQNCLISRSSTNRVLNAVTDRHTSMCFHGGLANLTRLLETCIRRCKVVDRIRRADVVRCPIPNTRWRGE